MNRLGRAYLLLWLGVMVMRLVVTDDFGSFVQQRMRHPLLVAAGVLLVFGVHETRQALAQEKKEPDSVRRSAGPRVGWLLLLPFLVLLSVAPAALGAAAADRVDPFLPTESDGMFTEIQSESGPVAMRVSEFLDRAIWDDSGSLEGVLVRLEGLVVNDASVPNGFKLTRFMVSCCAADGLPVQVTIRGAPALEDDTWVVAVVEWIPPKTPYRETKGEWIVEADAIDIDVSDAPKDPYESPY